VIRLLPLLLASLLVPSLAWAGDNDSVVSGDDDDSAAADAEQATDDDDSAAEPEGPDAWEWMTRAYAAKRSADWPAARAAFEAAVDAGADRYRVALELGHVAASVGDRAEAQRQWVVAAGSPDGTVARKARAELGAMGDVPAEDEAPSAWEWETRAHAAKRNEEWDKARSYFESARNAGADEHAIALDLAYVASLADDPEEAARQFQLAAESDDRRMAEQARGELAAMGVELPGEEAPPDEGETAPAPELPLKAKPVMERAWKLKKEDDFEGARTAFAEALKLGVDETRITQELAWLALAELALALEEERSADVEVAALAARGHLLALIEAEHDVAGTATQLGYLALGGGELTEAGDWFEEALEAGADPKTVALELGYVMLKLDAPALAERRFYEALEAGADPKDVAPSLAFLALEFDDPAEARRLFEAALADGASTMDLSLPLARVLIGLLALEEAATRIDEAEETGADARDVAEARASLALAWLQLVREREPDQDAPEDEQEAWEADRDAALAEAMERVEAALDAGADPATAAMQLGYLAVDAGDFPRAHEAFEQARLGGADQQTLALALGYLASQEKDYGLALERFRQTMKGPDEELRDRAQAELAPTLIALALQHRVIGKKHAENGRKDDARDAWANAHDALDEALDEGADPREVSLYRGYLEVDEGRIWSARARFRDAKRGEDDALAAQAKGELKGLPRMFWGDVYADAFAWYRFVPAESANLVPTLRVRGYFHPIPYVDLDFYLEFRISRDVASRAVGPRGYPEIYADNTAMLSIGAQFRFWKKRVGLFIQAGPVFKLVDDGARRVDFDLRAGAFFAHEWLECRPEPDSGARLDLHPCADVYSDLIYVSRFNHNLFFFARGRFGLGYMVTGPVSWAPVVEGRFLKDIRNDYYNNLVDVGLAHRWRLLKPFGLDFLFGIHAGTYFGLENVDPAPSTLGYVELRWQLATYIAF